MPPKKPTQKDIDKARLKKQAEANDARVKQQMSAKQKSRDQEQVQMAARVVQARAEEQHQKQLLQDDAAVMDAKIKAIVSAVIALRIVIPGANAGTNAGAPDIDGGVGNPIKIDPDVIPYSIYRGVYGPSDSGIGKFTIQQPGTNILIHCD